MEVERHVSEVIDFGEGFTVHRNIGERCFRTGRARIRSFQLGKTFFQVGFAIEQELPAGDDHVATFQTRQDFGPAIGRNPGLHGASGEAAIAFGDDDTGALATKQNGFTWNRKTRSAADIQPYVRIGARAKIARHIVHFDPDVGCTGFRVDCRIDIVDLAFTGGIGRARKIEFGLHACFHQRQIALRHRGNDPDIGIGLQA